ncbi:MAG TPA: heme exporter protein CcmB [Terriglobia bacterium]|nr:heme exporter protein CcmB [Terriglobia bacterium]
MRPVFAIIHKDIAIEFRNKESISSMLWFGLLVLVIFSFSFDTSDAEGIKPGILWVAFSFAGILGLNRSLSMESDNDCLQGLLLAPMDRGDLYLAKVAGNFVFTFAAEMIILPVFAVMQHLHFDLKLLWIVGITIAGTLGFVSIGTTLSMISAHTRMKEVILPILQIPMTLPVIIAAVTSTGMVLGEDTRGISFPLSLLGVFSIVYLTASYLIFEYVVEE